MGEQSTCRQCGASQAAADPVTALAWVSERLDGSAGPVRWLCPACARTHARDIEGKLPGEYW